MREKIRFSFFFFTFHVSTFKGAFNFYYISTRTDRDEGRGGIDGRRIIGAINRSIFVLSLSFFLFSPPLLGDQTETRMILILRKWRDRPRRGEMAAVED